MPELPEVETIRRDLQRLRGAVLDHVVVRLPKIVAPTAATFARVLKGATVTRIDRHAKLLAFHVRLQKAYQRHHDAVILVHLKMTGQLVLRDRRQLVFGGHPIVGATVVPNAYTHVEFHFDGGRTLYFNDLRQFGYVKLVTTSTAREAVAKLGVEPLTPAFSLQVFRDILKARQGRTLKAALLDQAGVAGIGNIYVDEACYRACVRPGRRVKSLSSTEQQLLWKAIRSVLALSVKHRGTSFNTYVDTDGKTGAFWRHRRVYGRKDEPCQRCKTQIRKTVVAGRGTHYCPHCQH